MTKLNNIILCLSSGALGYAVYDQMVPHPIKDIIQSLPGLEQCCNKIINCADREGNTPLRRYNGINKELDFECRGDDTFGGRCGISYSDGSYEGSGMITRKINCRGYTENGDFERLVIEKERDGILIYRRESHGVQTINDLSVSCDKAIVIEGNADYLCNVNGEEVILSEPLGDLIKGLFQNLADKKIKVSL